MKFFAEFGKCTPAGFAGWEHAVFIAVACVIICTLLFLSRNFSKEQVLKMINIIFYILLVLEIARIVFAVTRGGKRLVDTLPLTFCGLFLFALLFVIIGQRKKNLFYETGLIYMFYGGILAGVFYVLGPSSALSNYPLLHFISIQTLIFHSLMIYAGLLVVLKGLVEPNIKHFKKFFTFSFSFCLVAWALNIFFNTPYLYVKVRKTNPLLKVFNFAPDWLYCFGVVVVQSVAFFFVAYYFAMLIEHIRNNKENNK